MRTNPGLPREDPDRETWHAIRQGLLGQVDAIERRLGISPRTAELRRREKEEPRERVA